MPYKALWAADLTGGGTGAADKIPTATLADKNAVLVPRLSDLQMYMYAVDDDLGGTESSPSLIQPDDESGNKRLTQIGITLPNTGLHLLDTNASNYLNPKWNENDTADRTLNLLVNGADRSLTIEANAIISQDYSADSTTVSLAGLSLTGNLVMPEDGTVGASGLYFTFDDSGNVVTLIGGGLSLPTTLTFTGATTVNQIKMPDNLADALSVLQGANPYMTFVTTDGQEDIVFSESVDIIHTAIAAGEHGLEVDLDAANYGNVKAIDIDYITGQIDTGQDEGIILINIDESSADGGDVFALEVLATEGSADIYGLKAGALVGPVHQNSGTFANMDSALVNAVDRLTEFTTSDPGGANNVEIFSANTDTVTIGDAAKFEELEFLLETVASGGGIKPTFEFSTGEGTWTSFTPTDGTDGMRHSGVIAWDDADIPTWAADDTPEYLIRITRTRSVLTTPPVEDKVQIAAVTEYIWDKNGDLSIKGLTLAANSDVTLSGTGHVTSGSEGFIVGTLTITDGSIDDTDGSIALGDTNLTGVGTIGCGAITTTGNIVMPANGVIGVTDGNPQIVFDNANNWLEITGNVGIGTTSANAQLDVETADLEPAGYLTATHASYNGIVLRIDASRAATDSYELIRARANGVNQFVVKGNGETYVGDHGMAATDMVVNVCYGTGSPPAANTTTEGTLFIKYVA